MVLDNQRDVEGEGQEGSVQGDAKLGTLQEAWCHSPGVQERGGPGGKEGRFVRTY